MPYIEEKDRLVLDPLIEALSYKIGSTGGLNYSVTRLVLRYILINRLKYATLESVVGMFMSAMLEMWGRVAAIYERVKRIQNGDVPEYIILEELIQKMEHR